MEQQGCNYLPAQSSLLPPHLPRLCRCPRWQIKINDADKWLNLSASPISYASLFSVQETTNTNDGCRNSWALIMQVKTVPACFIQRQMRGEMLLVGTIASLQMNVWTSKCFSLVTFPVNLIEFLSGYPVYLMNDESDQTDLWVFL